MSFLKPKQAKSTSTSENTNNALLTSTYSPSMTMGTNAMGALSGELSGGFDNYLQKAGFAPAMRQLSQNVVGQGAASGLLNSGATSRALLTKGTELNNQFYNNYLQQLSGLSGLGLQAGSIIANAGQKSNSTSKGGGPSTLGSIASTVGGIASIFSDPRLKRDIVKLGELSDGLGIYAYRYVMSKIRYVGVMADEVAKLRPWALGPKISGFMTVDYGAL